MRDHGDSGKGRLHGLRGKGEQRKGLEHSRWGAECRLSIRHTPHAGLARVVFVSLLLLLLLLLLLSWVFMCLAMVEQVLV